MFPKLPVQLSTECTHNDTLNSDPFFIFDGTCHKIQSQTNRHPSINCLIRCRKPLPPSILLISTCSLTPSYSSYPVINWQCDKHRREWPILDYRKIMVIYPYPFLVVISLLFSWKIFINYCIGILIGSTG